MAAARGEASLQRLAELAEETQDRDAISELETELRRMGLRPKFETLDDLQSALNAAFNDAMWDAEHHVVEGQEDFDYAQQAVEKRFSLQIPYQFEDASSPDPRSSIQGRATWFVGYNDIYTLELMPSQLGYNQVVRDGVFKCIGRIIEDGGQIPGWSDSDLRRAVVGHDWVDWIEVPVPGKDRQLLIDIGSVSTGGEGNDETLDATIWDPRDNGTGQTQTHHLKTLDDVRSFLRETGIIQ